MVLNAWSTGQGLLRALGVRGGLVLDFQDSTCIKKPRNNTDDSATEDAEGSTED
jgi:hypothetical protein